MVRAHAVSEGVREMRLRDWLLAFADLCALCAFSPLLLLLSLFCEADPNDGYKFQNW